jgi:alcohol dehydrogenase class IV
MLYEFSLATRVVFGLHASENVASHIQKAGRSMPRSVLVVTSGDGWNEDPVKRISDTLLEHGSKNVRIFNGVQPNPDFSCVKACVHACRKSKADVAIAFGGGSAIDAAKCAAHDSRTEYLITIPTTAGTGSEISPWAVITDPKSRIKLSMIKKTPDLAILDPLLTLSLPPMHTLACGMDAFSHALESYVSKSANSFTDAIAFHAMELIGKNLETAVRDGKNIQARKALLEGSLLAGIAMLHSGLGLIHAIANSVGGIYHELCHGLIIARILAETLRYNRKKIPKDKYEKVQPCTEALVASVQGTFSSLLEAQSVKVKEKDLPLIVERSLENVNVHTNPRKPAGEDIEDLVRRCFSLRRRE